MAVSFLFGWFVAALAVLPSVWAVWIITTRQPHAPLEDEPRTLQITARVGSIGLLMTPLGAYFSSVVPMLPQWISVAWWFMAAISYLVCIGSTLVVLAQRMNQLNAPTMSMQLNVIAAVLGALWGVQLHLSASALGGGSPSFVSVGCVWLLGALVLIWLSVIVLPLASDRFFFAASVARSAYAEHFASSDHRSER